ncbi:hypothetical protein EVAR_20290_1 [Eumeta japonica]|uniref:Uncharacterized protein n=1 Tax=Eumeta variegata TaxID=151549 RepID=A0A4C1VM03_EUMVA|nr:hypothetical protein EVAR_20290_1 [Eumeta japonica]
MQYLTSTLFIKISQPARLRTALDRVTPNTKNASAFSAIPSHMANTQEAPVLPGNTGLTDTVWDATTLLESQRPHGHHWDIPARSQKQPLSVYCDALALPDIIGCPF